MLSTLQKATVDAICAASVEMVQDGMNPLVPMASALSTAQNMVQRGDKEMALYLLEKYPDFDRQIRVTNETVKALVELVAMLGGDEDEEDEG